MNQNNVGFSGPIKNVDRDKQCSLNRLPLVDNMNPTHFPGVSQLTLTGTKVPTENLTPQQRQHRAEQLATLRKMHEMLFPENQTQPTGQANRNVPMEGPLNHNVVNPNSNVLEAQENLDSPMQDQNSQIMQVSYSVHIK